MRYRIGPVQVCIGDLIFGTTIEVEKQDVYIHANERTDFTVYCHSTPPEKGTIQLTYPINLNNGEVETIWFDAKLLRKEKDNKYTYKVTQWII